MDNLDVVNLDHDISFNPVCRCQKGRKKEGAPTFLGYHGGILGLSCCALVFWPPVAIAALLRGSPDIKRIYEFLTQNHFTVQPLRPLKVLPFSSEKLVRSQAVHSPLYQCKTLISLLKGMQGALIPLRFSKTLVRLPTAAEKPSFGLAHPHEPSLYGALRPRQLSELSPSNRVGCARRAGETASVPDESGFGKQAG